VFILEGYVSREAIDTAIRLPKRTGFFDSLHEQQFTFDTLRTSKPATMI
jgi:hypothetical protein